MIAVEILAVAAAQAVGCPANFASYDVAYIGDKQFQIEAEFQNPQTEFGFWYQPTAERPEGQSESIHDLTAQDSQGRDIDIAYVGYGEWKTSQDATRIRYTLLVDHDEIEWPHGADEVGHPFGDGYYFSGTAFFIAPSKNRPPCTVDVQFHGPENWTLTAPWAVEELHGKANSFGDLQDNGFAIGPFEAVTQNVGALSITSVFDPRLAKDVRPFVSNVLDDLLPAYADYFNGKPAADYSTFHFGYSSSDGSAFERSFTLQYEWPLNMTERPMWAHVLGHETMHLWTGVIQRADHEIEWFSEGFTDYLTVKHLYREGYLDDEGLRQQIAGFVSRHQLGKRMSQGVSLRDAGQNKGQNWFLIYGSGALIALILDADLSTAEPGSFDAVMAALYADSAEPYDFDRLMAFFDERSDGRASEIFNAVDGGLRPGGVNALLAPAGIGIAGRMETTYVSFEKNCRKKRGCVPDFLAKPKRRK